MNAVLKSGARRRAEPTTCATSPAIIVTPAILRFSSPVSFNRVGTSLLQNIHETVMSQTKAWDTLACLSGSDQTSLEIALGARQGSDTHIACCNGHDVAGVLVPASRGF